MKYRPTDAELLDAIAGLLEDDVMPAVPALLQHQVRVAANLARILERQQTLETPALEREQQALSALLGVDASLTDLRAELDRRLREDDPTLDEGAVWDVLVATARDDLATAKPGYDHWEGG